MNRPLLLCSIWLVLGFALPARADELAAAGHPSPLLLTEARLQHIRELEKGDPLMAELLAAIRTVAEDNLTLPPVNHRSSSGGARLNDYRAAAGRIETAAFVYRLTGDKCFLESARRDLRDVAAAPDWNPGHFLDVAEMGLGASRGYAWLGADLGADRATVRETLFNNILKMAPAAYDPSGGGGLNWSAFGTGDKTTNNWNFVCNAGFIATALALREEQPELARIVLDGARRSLPLAMAGYAPDGAWPEGPTYWIYGTTFLVHSLALLEEGVGADSGLLGAPGLDKTMFYGMQLFGPSGVSFNFGDSGPARAHEAALSSMVWLSRHFNRPEVLPEIRRRLETRLRAPISAYERSLPPGGRARGLIDCALFFPERTDGSVAKPPLASHFRGQADFAVLRSPAADGFWVALKGGTNGASHGHLDLGSFVLDAQGLRWAIDLGGDNYSFPGYWDYAEGGRRWSYYRLNNRSHNTLALGDGLQRADATAPVVGFSPENAAGESSAVVDLTPAYPGLAKRMLRGVRMEANGTGVFLQDDIEGLVAGTPIVWRMLTAAAVSISPDGRTATLAQADHQLQVQLFSPVSGEARFTVESASPPTGAEKQNSGVSVLAIAFTPAAGDVRIAVRFSFDGDAAVASRGFEPVPVRAWKGIGITDTD